MDKKHSEDGGTPPKPRSKTEGAARSATGRTGRAKPVGRKSAPGKSAGGKKGGATKPGGARKGGAQEDGAGSQEAKPGHRKGRQRPRSRPDSDSASRPVVDQRPASPRIPAPPPPDERQVGSGRTFGGHRLDRFQEEAIEAIEEGRSVVVAAPTGAGKTLIAEYAVTEAMKHGQRVVYTAPIKALSNQKYRDFREAFGPELVGIMTGDLVLNPTAPLVIMTTEIFRNTVFDEPGRVELVRTVVFDEIHYMDDVERGTVWEESLIFAPKHMQIVALSATIPNLDAFVSWLSWVRQTNVVSVATSWRPVPLEHKFFLPRTGVVELPRLASAYQKTARQTSRPTDRRRGRPQSFAADRMKTEADSVKEVLKHVAAADQLPCLVFSFSRASCQKYAETAFSGSLVDREASREILTIYDDLCRRYSIYGDRGADNMRGLVARGIAFHHAGMLPALKEVIERLFTTAKVKLIFTTETFAVGINMPARSVVFCSLRKYDGTGVRPLKTRDYFQMAGRAGRRGLDEQGTVYSCIDPDGIRIGDVERVVKGTYEPVTSRFDLSYSSVINLWEHLGERIFEAVDLSFGAFRAGPKVAARMHEKVEAKLRILEDTGYLDAEGITAKGRVAGSIFGYEIQLSELESAGMLRTLEPERLAALLAALAFEARKGDWFLESELKRYKKLFVSVESILGEFRAAEERHGLPEGIKSPDGNIIAAAMAWMRGCDLDELEKYASCGAGDVVRVFRMANQMLRSLRKLVARANDEEYLERIDVAMHLINRNEVDAEAQLQVE